MGKQNGIGYLFYQMWSWKINKNVEGALSWNDGKIEEIKEKIFVVDDYMLDKLLDKIKEIIGIKNFDDTKILIETDDKLPDEITLKNVVILITCVIKDFDKLFLGEALFNE